MKYSELPTNANDLYQLAIWNLKYGTLPRLGDDTFPTTVSIIEDSSVFTVDSNFGMLSCSLGYERRTEVGIVSESCVPEITEVACRDMGAVATSDAPEDSIESHVLAVWIPQYIKFLNES